MCSSRITRKRGQFWAERYDRTLEDSLGLQGELAAQIAKTLRAKLSPEEKERVARKPTNNAEAYALYLRAFELEHRPDTLLRDYEEAEQLYRQAIVLDPDFALAHAHLASTCAAIFHFHEPLESWAVEGAGGSGGGIAAGPKSGRGAFRAGVVSLLDG